LSNAFENEVSMFSDEMQHETPKPRAGGVAGSRVRIGRWLARSGALAAVLSSSVARAQLSDSVAAMSVEQYPGAESDGVAGETNLRVLRTSVGAPVPLSEGTTLVVGAAYERLDIHTGAGEELELHAPKALFGGVQRLSERWGLMAFSELGLASSLDGSLGSEDLLLSLTGIATYAVSDSFQLGAGIIYDRRSGELAPMPALMLRLRLSERLRVRGFAPVWLRAECRATPWLDVGLRSSFESNRFHFADGAPPDRDAELAYSNLTVGPQLTLNFSDWTHLDLYAAGALYRRYELFDDDERFAREGLSPVVGYGARLWIAPSGW
jgi:hypothetical protein